VLISTSAQVADRAHRDRRNQGQEARLALADDLGERDRQLADLQQMLATNNAKLAEAQKVQAEMMRRERELEDSVALRYLRKRPLRPRSCDMLRRQGKRERLAGTRRTGMAFRRYSEAYVAEEEQARMARRGSGRSFYPTLGLEASIISGTLSVPIDAQPTKWAASSNRVSSVREWRRRGLATRANYSSVVARRSARRL